MKIFSIFFLSIAISSWAFAEARFTDAKNSVFTCSFIGLNSSFSKSNLISANEQEALSQAINVYTTINLRTEEHGGEPYPALSLYAATNMGDLKVGDRVLDVRCNEIGKHGWDMSAPASKPISGR